jgi:hypothetical protein
MISKATKRKFTLSSGKPAELSPFPFCIAHLLTMVVFGQLTSCIPNRTSTYFRQGANGTRIQEP